MAKARPAHDICALILLLDVVESNNFQSSSSKEIVFPHDYLGLRTNLFFNR